MSTGKIPTWFIICVPKWPVRYCTFYNSENRFAGFRGKETQNSKLVSILVAVSWSLSHCRLKEHAPMTHHCPPFPWKPYSPLLHLTFTVLLEPRSWCSEGLLFLKKTAFLRFHNCQHASATSVSKHCWGILFGQSSLCSSDRSCPDGIATRNAAQ